MITVEVTWDENEAYARDRGWRVSTTDVETGDVYASSGADVVSLIDDALAWLDVPVQVIRRGN